MLNPCELEIDLFCKGIRIGESCTLGEDARHFSRTRAGLGSGLELVIPGPLKEIWMNAPVEEPFAQESPYVLEKEGKGYIVLDTRDGARYQVKIPFEPAWYSKKTSRGIEMRQIGVLQGTYLGIYVSETCGFWYHKESKHCRFCTTGLNVGKAEMKEKVLSDIIETARAAKEESGVTFVHLNTGYHGNTGLDVMAPYVKALKEEVGVMVGVQCIPSRDLWKYDWLIDLGANHFSFCYEFHNKEYFANLLPGKEELVGQQTFFDAMAYAAKKLPRGAVSGEIIAGVEPIPDTIRAIDFITDCGAFPTVCIFRPVIGSSMADVPVPRFEDMVPVMRHMYESCRRKLIPVGLAPNIEVSLIVNPDDARYLVPQDWKETLYRTFIETIRPIAGFKFRHELRPRTIKGSAVDNSRFRPVSPQHKPAA